jgi:NAD(P)-dependent dehydrogenase (short-subunit alcohol dehydrogenase family)
VDLKNGNNMIVITGASRGIGRFLLESYAKDESESLIGLFLNSKPTDYSQVYQKLDVTNQMAVQQFVDSNISSLQNLTLINCAGVNYNAFAHKADIEKWMNVIETNLFGTFNLIRYLLPLMREQKFGRIINFSSVVANKSTPGVSAYAASKSALWGLAKTIAIENASLNITINNINLGYSKLGMIEQVPAEFKEKIISQIPAGKLCDPADILNTVNYLRSTSYITGSSIDLSGGLV